MKLPPRWITVLGVVISLAAVLLDTQVQAVLGILFGTAAATKLAAIGTLLAAIGRALVPPAASGDGWGD